MTTQPVSSTTYVTAPDGCPVNVAARPDDTIDAFFGDDQQAVILTFTPAGLRAFTAKMIRAGRRYRVKARIRAVEATDATRPDLGAV